MRCGMASAHYLFCTCVAIVRRGFPLPSSSHTLIEENGEEKDGHGDAANSTGDEGKDLNNVHSLTSITTIVSAFATAISTLSTIVTVVVTVGVAHTCIQHMNKSGGGNTTTERRDEEKQRKW
mmetsp:Transcript_34100/g.87961  ORF Transcript_34100/g.87961 Transcript_34100/m.87961 type:complete len:122 (-) Transcript_34100:1861-2226(-)